MKRKICLLLMLTCVLLQAKAQQILTIDRALQIAYDNSPDIRASEIQLNRSNLLLNAAKAGQKTQFSLDLTPIDFSQSRQFDNRFAQWYTREDYSLFGSLTATQPIVWTGGTIALTNQLGWQSRTTEGIEFQGVTISESNENRSFYNNLFLRLEQPLFTYNRISMELGELELSLTQAELNYSIQKLQIELNVSQAFYDVFTQRASLDIARDEYENQQRNYDVVKNKVESGLIAREELFQSEVNLSNSESTLKNQELNYENAKDDLKLLLGMDLFENIDVEADVNTTYPEINMDFAISEGLKNRKELARSDIQIQLAQNDLVRVNSENEFRGDLTAQMGVFGENESFSNLYRDRINNPSISLRFQIPVYDWGRNRMRVEAQELQIENTILDKNIQERDIVIGIRRSHRSLQNLLIQIEIAEKGLRNSQLTFELNQERYANGDITGLELNQYQNQLSQARIDLLSAQINYKLELLNMKTQTLWDFEKNKSLLENENKN